MKESTESPSSRRRTDSKYNQGLTEYKGTPHPKLINKSHQCVWPKTSGRNPDLQVCHVLHLEQLSCPLSGKLLSTLQNSDLFHPVCGMCIHFPRGSWGCPPINLCLARKNTFSWKLLQEFTLLETILFHSNENASIQSGKATKWEICLNPVWLCDLSWPSLTLTALLWKTRALGQTIFRCFLPWAHATETDT